VDEDVDDAVDVFLFLLFSCFCFSRGYINQGYFGSRRLKIGVSRVYKE
jgi:hypothetical protein